MSGRHTRAIDQFGGIAASMPMFAMFFVFAVLSSVGLPGLNGFVGEYMILLGSFQASPFWASLAVLGVIFGAVYLLSATRRVLFGPLIHEANAKLTDMVPREIGMCIPIILVSVWIGVAPNTCLGKLDGSIDQLVDRLDGARVALELSNREQEPKLGSPTGAQEGPSAMNPNDLDFDLLLTPGAWTALWPMITIALGLMMLLAAEVVSSLRPFRSIFFLGTLGIAALFELRILAGPESLTDTGGIVLGGALVADATSAVWGLDLPHRDGARLQL